jgi:hypothetical protein
MVMTKTELKKQQVAAVLEFLENEIGVEFDGTDEGGRLGFTVTGFRGDFSRRDMEVCLWESTPLSGHGWTPAEVLLQQEAEELEKQINDEIRELINQ